MKRKRRDDFDEEEEGKRRRRRRRRKSAKQKHHRVRDLRGSGVGAGAPVEIGQQEKRRVETIGREDAETPRRIRRGCS